jgi:hypothetical protein
VIVRITTIATAAAAAAAAAATVIIGGRIIYIWITARIAGYLGN